MRRRDFLKGAVGGMAALAVGNMMPWMRKELAFAQASQNLQFEISDAIKQMATYTTQSNPTAQCYFWIYKDINTATNLNAECPGPMIFAMEGETIQVTLLNSLDENHSFGIGAYAPGLSDPDPLSTLLAQGPVIGPGQTATFTFTVPPAGTYLYYDYLNTPVNRVMGLHGALISMPKGPAPGGTNPSPYGARATTNVQRLFDDFGTAPWWPGLAWHEKDIVTSTPAYRQYIWLLHQASPILFAQVGNHTPGQDFPAAEFVTRFLKERFNPTGASLNYASPQYFTISGQAGHFSHNSPYLCPNHRSGEPVLLRLLNAGIWSHSMHVHANHVYITAVNGVVGAADLYGPNDNLLWVDVFNIDPGCIVDYALPYMRPPDVPNDRGWGRSDLQGHTFGNVTTWPPLEELNITIRNQRNEALSVPLTQLCYPMHDHSEPSQTSQGGNYNMGMISGVNFVGDRALGQTVEAMNFPHQRFIYCPGTDANFDFRTGLYSPAIEFI